MHEIGMIACCQPAHHGVRPIDDQVVPAHVRHFQPRGRDTRHSRPRSSSGPGSVHIRASARQQLHADTDAQERAAAAQHSLVQGLLKPIDGCKGPAAGGKGAVSRQDQMIGPRHTTSGSAVTVTAMPAGAISSNAFCAECRLPLS